MIDNSSKFPLGDTLKNENAQRKIDDSLFLVSFKRMLKYVEIDDGKDIVGDTFDDSIWNDGRTNTVILHLKSFLGESLKRTVYIVMKKPFY